MSTLHPLCVYIAARFDRQAEMKALIPRFNSMGWGMCARWVSIEQEWVGADGGGQDQANYYATHDLEDIREAEVVFCFTEPGGRGPARGGRHVEFGYALALQKPTIVIAPEGIENVFYSKATFVAKTLDEAFAWLSGYTRR